MEPMKKPLPGYLFEVVNYRDIDIGVDLEIKIEHNNTGSGKYNKFYFLQNDNLKLNLKSNVDGNLHLEDFYKTPQNVKIYKPDIVGRKYLCAMLKFIIQFTRQMPIRIDKKSIIKLFTPYIEAAEKVYIPLGFSIVARDANGISVALREDRAYMESSVGSVIDNCARVYSKKSKKPKKQRYPPRKRSGEMSMVKKRKRCKNGSRRSKKPRYKCVKNKKSRKKSLFRKRK